MRYWFSYEDNENYLIIIIIILTLEHPYDKIPFSFLNVTATEFKNFTHLENKYLDSSGSLISHLLSLNIH